MIIDTLFLVLIKANHLIKELVRYLIQRSHLVWSYSNLNVRQVPNDRLEFRIVDTI